MPTTDKPSKESMICAKHVLERVHGRRTAMLEYWQESVALIIERALQEQSESQRKRLSKVSSLLEQLNPCEHAEGRWSCRLCPAWTFDDDPSMVLHHSSCPYESARALVLNESEADNGEG